MTRLLWSWGGVHSTGPAGDRWNSAVSKGKKNSWPRPGGAHWEGFKLGSKGEGNIVQLTRDEQRLGVPRPGVRLTAQLKCAQ